MSGTSAGAVNAVMVADGLARGGPEEARKRMADFWRAASRDGDMSKLNRAISDRLFSLIPIAVTPFQPWFDAMSRNLSPYDLNPLNINPLKDLIVRFADFDAIRKSDIPLFIAATNVQTGKLRVFPRDKDRRRCGDGLGGRCRSCSRPWRSRACLTGTAATPQTRRSIRSSAPRRPRTSWWCRSTRCCGVPTPHSAQEITNRINEITFNASLISEYRAIEFVRRLIDKGALKRGMGPDEYRRINVHRVDLGIVGRKLTAESRLNIDFDFFEMLHRAGRRAGRRFLDQHFDDIGVRSTIDLRDEMKPAQDETMPADVDDSIPV